MKLSRNHIKLIAILSMFCDHATKLFVSENTIMYKIGRDVIGRVAFPLFGFLLVEGFFNTKNKKQHIVKLITLAIISEPIYDSVFQYGWNEQSIIINWVLCYLLLCFMAFIDNSKKIKNLHLQFEIKSIAMLGFGYLSYLLKLDYPWVAVLSAYCSYEVYSSSKITNYWKPILSVGLFSLFDAIIFNSLGALIAIIPVLYYTPNIKQTNKIYRHLLYWSYPIHLFILKAISFYLQ